MKDDRLRVPIDDPYLHAVGLAVICFARLEWDAVYCYEGLASGYIKTVSGKTAGQISADLVRLIGEHDKQSVRESLGAAALEFRRLVRRRNDLLHANPATLPNGDQRLVRGEETWTIQQVEKLADEFVAAGIPLNYHI